VVRWEKRIGNCVAERSSQVSGTDLSLAEPLAVNGTAKSGLKLGFEARQAQPRIKSQHF